MCLMNPNCATGGDIPSDPVRNPCYSDPAFLQALDAGRAIGLGATESMLLSPAKSVTAVLGFIGSTFIAKYLEGKL